MRLWIVYSFAALLVWGLWGVLSKLVSMHLPARSAMLFEAMGYVIGTLVIATLYLWVVEWNAKGALFGIFTGFCAAFGSFLFIQALSLGKASIVVIVTSLYPLVTVVILFLLFREALTVREGVGILLALSALALLARA